MKKFSVTLCVFLAVTFCFLNMYYSGKAPVFGKGIANYEVYLSDGSFGDILTLKNSTDVIRLKGVKGEAFTQTDFCLQGFLAEYGAEVLFTERIEGGVSYYCYSKSLKYAKVVNGQRVNLQIYLKEGRAKIGSPLIYGSF